MSNKQRIFRIITMDARTLSWWNTNRDQIDMNPSYQRKGNLWSNTNKSFLIDTILNNFDIPKFYLADFTLGVTELNKNKLPYAIIDGKQRFEAIFDFFDNKIRLNENFTLLRDPSLKLGGLYYRDLQKEHPRLASQFDNSNLTVMSVITNDEESINSLFVRLNRSTPLTGAEIRNAMAGKPTDINRKVSQHDFFTSTIKFSTLRGTDYDTAGKLIMFEYSGKPVETKKKNLDQFFGSTDLNEDHLELAGRKVLENLDIMKTIFLPEDPLLSHPGIVPTYYWVIRQVRSNRYWIFRDIFASVELKRREVNRKVRQHIELQDQDQEYLAYHNYFRAPNDSISHEKRADFLIRKIENYAAS